MQKQNESCLNSWGLLRFSIIGHLLARPPSKGELRKELKKLAERQYRHPTEDKWITFCASTIERWYYSALKADDPVRSLRRKVRSDAGKTTAIRPALLEELKKQYDSFPHWSYQLHTDNLAALVKEKPGLGNTPSYSTVARRMKDHGWDKKRSVRRNQTPGQKRAAERIEKREIRGFESKYVNELWHLDFHKGRRIVDVNGEWHTPKALCILDDSSRLCCHIQWYLDETAESLYHGLIQAFYKRGLPRGLMTDNGSAMLAGETRNGLAHLGIMHHTTLPYSPYQNGKQESFWGHLEGRLISMLSNVQPLTLDFLNKTSLAWVEMEYNSTMHKEICSAPVDKFIKGRNVSRSSPDAAIMRFAFSIPVTRTVRRSDGTIQIDGKRFEIPSRFRHFRKLHLKYQSWNLSMAHIVDKQSGDPIAVIYPQDKIKNASGARRSIVSLEETTPKENCADPIPPLLRKYLSDYAATGLPPGYIPQKYPTENIKENNDE